MKKLLVIGILFILLTGAVIAPYVIDNVACASFAGEVQEKIVATQGVYPIEIIYGCTNTGGTGNHTDLWVAARVATDLSEEELKALFPEAYTAQTEEETVTMASAGKHFGTIYCGTEPCYTIEFSKSAPCSALDMRGH